MQGLVQGDRELVENYVNNFSLLRESLCRSLPKGKVPLDVMKKDRFIIGLKGTL